MIVFYNKHFNIDLGLLNYLHPFDGKKFENVFNEINNLDQINIKSPSGGIAQEEIDNFVDSLLRLLLHKKRYILRALEIPYIPILPFSVIDKRILLPMRWGVSGTIEATRTALTGVNCWNLSGGYHHATRAVSEGFCIYNDIGITFDTLKKEGKLSDESKILIIDIDAHHGNGNAYVFMDNKNVKILDIYNNTIYPKNTYTKERVDINIPLSSGVNGDIYLSKLKEGLNTINSGFDLAYVIAGTDVLSTDPLGGLKLSINDCIERDTLVLEKLLSISTPAIYLGGGGYSKDSAKTITGSISKLYKQ